MPTINFDMAFLPTKALTVHHGETKNFHLGECGLDRFQAMRLNDGNYQFHRKQGFQAGEFDTEFESPSLS